MISLSGNAQPLQCYIIQNQSQNLPFSQYSSGTNTVIAISFSYTPVTHSCVCVRTCVHAGVCVLNEKVRNLNCSEFLFSSLILLYIIGNAFTNLVLFIFVHIILYCI